uniref:Uncharacterized protein n=1 Tax=Megaselia scalaris TaxID=36166 RepID=T1GG67_MEGSC
MKKEKNGSNTIVKEIFLHNTTVYLGCEKKRDCPWSWSLTFIENLNKDIVRTRETPFVGHVVAGSEWADRIMWFASIWYNFYGENALPPAEIILK